jgi:hypothetical protein
VTASSSRQRLSDLQREFLRRFSARTAAFFLTGGAVLVEWVLGHRRTDDLDLFTDDDEAMASADRLVRGVAAELAATVEPVQATPDFRRYVIRAGDDSVVVDLIRDRTPQLRPKVARDGILTDSVEEIVANKICALLGRAELRDLVDLYFLERAGHRVEDFLADAERKDAGVTPAAIAWVLSEMVVPESPPGNVDRAALQAFAHELEARLRRLAAPVPPRAG